MTTDPNAASPPTDEPPWRLWMAPAALLTGLAGGVFAASIVAVIGHSAGSSLSHPSPAVSLTGDLAFDLAFVASALYFSAVRGRPRASDFGFRRVSPKRAVGAILAAGVAYYVLTGIYAAVFKLHGNDKLPSELGAGKSTAALIAAGIFVCVVAPVAEEFFFRGFLFGVLRRWRIRVAGREIGIWIAAVVTGILFGLAHTGSASVQYLIPLGFLGFVLCIVRWRTGSLYPCMALHCINNSLALGINQLHWNALEILAMILGSLLVIGAATLPLARPVLITQRPATHP
jgi:membrane protease YdiL (CAAX protease family)